MNSKSKGLVRISLVEKIKFQIVSVILGIWFLLKTELMRLWRTRGDNASVGSPPSCLTDASVGTHSYTKLNGVKFHFVEAGDKKLPLVLLLHGFPDCWISWRHQIPELSKHFRVVALDLKGFGDSDKPLSTERYSVEELTREIHEFIHILGYNRCTIIGHDLGGLIGWFFVHLYPDSVSKFVAVSAPHPNQFWGSESHFKSFPKRWVEFCQLPFLPEQMFLQNDLSLLTQVHGHLKTTDELPYLTAYKYAFSRTEDWTGPINYYRTLPYWRLQLTELYQTSTLLIVGNQESSSFIENVIKSSEYVEKFSVKVVNHAGHFPHQEKPDELNERLISFLIGNPPVALDKPSNGIVNRMFGAVSSTVKYGTGVIDVVQKKTNGLTSRALSFGQNS